ncbi:gastric triacylglycerol lipase-like [Parasteatoda tepidariorum]|uniref:gastric triacylglycerol lipase-like n=1 Tax=Parasteatoda tepidariorum TaxID=114398 RepID=UPI001C727BD0|nr:gastric triacylglycerol lipase-like [Parasteatoda tepidariorum]
MNFLLLVVLHAYPYSVVYSDISNDINNDINNEINDINNNINNEINDINNDINNDMDNIANFIEDPDINRNVTELITSKGYPVENHFAYTEDGYELSLQRIPYGKLNKETGNRKPVLLQHGLMQSSADWVINYPHQSLGFLLADNGYDVWLGNTRGGAYSRQHLNFQTNSKDFWDFSFDQMAEYDLPAMIDYILNTTKEDNLVYIGHSQGTTIAFALLSERPLYNEKIKLFVALAPEVEVSHVKSIVSYLVPYFEYIESIMNTFGVYEFMSNNPAQQFITRNLCASKSAFICENIMYMVFGKDSEQYNQTRTPVYASHFPNGASMKNIVHFSQMVKSKKFRKFDYGKENWKYYNQKFGGRVVRVLARENSIVSFDQMAEYDLPAMIDYILNTTKEDNLVYIGHSQGTTIAFALLSERPLYNEKIKLFVALAPEVEVSHVKSIVSYLVPYFEYIESIMNTFGVYEFMSNNPAQQFITRNLCASKSAFICENIMYMVFGKDSEQYNQTRTPVYAAHFPNGASIKNVVHFSQMVKSKKFRKFDYGKENWKYYNQDTPPEYNLSNVVTPTALFWGMNDALADTEDISLLEKRLKSLVYSYCVPWKNFSHFDFVLAKDAKKLVYDEIMSLIKQFQNNKAPFINKSFERKACQ